MKKILLVVPLLAIALFFILKERHETAPLSSRTTVAPQAKTKSRKEVFLGKRVVPVGPEVSPCGNTETVLNGLDFNLDSHEWIKDVPVESLAHCENFLSANSLTKVKENCYGEKPKGECTSYMLILRSMLRARKITDPVEREEYADLIVAEFGKATPDFKRLEKLSAKLMDLFPNELVIQKLWATSRFVNQPDPKNVSPEVTREIYDRVSPELWKDSQTAGLKLIMDTGLKPTAVEAQTRAILRERPDDVSTIEMLGWSLWNQNRKEEALTEVRRAMEINPKDEWLRNLYANLQAKNANQSTYSGRLSVGFNFDDLFH